MENNIRSLAMILSKDGECKEKCFSFIQKGFQVGFTSSWFEVNEDIQLQLEDLPISILQFMRKVILEGKMKRVVRENGQIVFQKYDENNVLNHRHVQFCVSLYKHILPLAPDPFEMIRDLRHKYIQNRSDVKIRYVIEQIFHSILSNIEDEK